MTNHYLFIIFLLTCFLFWSEEFNLIVDKTLKDGNWLAKNQQTTVDVERVNQNGSEALIFINVNVMNKIYERNPTISVFFANDDHNILKVSFDKKVKIVFYEFPYKVKEIFANASNFDEIRNFDSVKLSSNFTETWMPVNASKINAALEFSDGTIYNTYGIANYEISIDDLMILEEYKELNV